MLGFDAAGILAASACQAMTRAAHAGFDKCHGFDAMTTYFLTRHISFIALIIRAFAKRLDAAGDAISRRSLKAIFHATRFLSYLFTASSNISACAPGATGK